MNMELDQDFSVDWTCTTNTTYASQGPHSWLNLPKSLSTSNKCWKNMQEPSRPIRRCGHWPQLLTQTKPKHVKHTRSRLFVAFFSMSRSHVCLSFSKSVFVHCTNWIGNMLCTWSFQYHTISLLSRVLLPWLQTACFNTWVVGYLFFLGHFKISTCVPESSPSKQWVDSSCDTNKKLMICIPHICHFFTRAKLLENKIYTEIYTVNCQFTQ